MTFEIDSKEPFLIKVRYFTDIFCAVKKKKKREKIALFSMCQITVICTITWQLEVLAMLQLSFVRHFKHIWTIYKHFNVMSVSNFN